MKVLRLLTFICAVLAYTAALPQPSNYTYSGTASASITPGQGKIIFSADGWIVGGDPLNPGTFYIQAFVDGAPVYSSSGSIPLVTPGYLYSIDHLHVTTPGYHTVEWRGYAIPYWPQPTWNIQTTVLVT